MSKKLLTDNVELMKQWDYEKNRDVDLSKITFSSGKKYWWRCEKGHSHYASVAAKNRGLKCPFCSGKKALMGYNDLFTVCPELKDEWDYEKNEIDPSKITAGSSKKAWWRCKKGHSYEMRISHRKAGHGCPYCNGNKFLSGENDFETWCNSDNPIALKRWDYDKNTVLPSEVGRHSNINVWWKCPICGNEYQNAIKYEYDNLFCPKCNKKKKTSFPEQALYYYLKQIFPEVINGYKDTKHGITEIDIYIPSINLGIEYDGANWHWSKTHFLSEEKKYKMCIEQQIHLIRFKEALSSEYSNSNVADEIIKSSYADDKNVFNDELQTFINRFSTEIRVDLQKDKSEILNQYLVSIKEDSLAKKYPLIAEEWDYEKNSPLTPDMISAFINEKFWFKCSNNHSYEAYVYKRTGRNDGCPFCSGKKVLIGFNDLATTHREIAEEWDYEKNFPLTPEDVSKGYDKKVWWKCKKCGNQYECSPNTRTSQNVGCSICKGGVSKKVKQYDLTGKYINTFKSCTEAGRAVGLSLSAISQACRTKCATAGYQWRYATDDSKNDIDAYEKKIFNNIPVVQYSLDGKYIKCFDSITIAEKETGASKIGMVCKGKRKSSGGFIWKYKIDGTNINLKE